ncbi:uncharacterized protein LOC109597516 [Aethina tumida]|uniref:uncharacterized protein LOC109597516 n=1 Tax=Aethina tumida TaxID=116153 RepID=UPI00096B21BE|nr:uncharacterized protein LOC109597516 [Aethina tumida]
MRVWSLLFVFFLVFESVVLDDGNDHQSNNLIREDERRGASHEDNDEIESKKRSLFSFSSFGGIGGIGGHGGGGGRHHHHHHQQPQQPSGYGSSGPSGYGYANYGGSYGPPSAHGYDQEEYGHSLGHSAPGGNYGQVQHGYGGGGEHSGLYLKKLLIPLAGIAILGAAAALSTNPVLLQLGVVNGRRKRRSIEEKMLMTVYPANPKVKPDT